MITQHMPVSNELNVVHICLLDVKGLYFSCLSVKPLSSNMINPLA